MKLQLAFSQVKHKKVEKSKNIKHIMKSNNKSDLSDSDKQLNVLHLMANLLKGI